MLGEAGATVICTGRSVRGHPATPGRPETIEETADMVTERGGRGVAIQVDHTSSEQVASLATRVSSEFGLLHVLVNDVWGGDALTEWGVPFWELDLDRGMRMLNQALHSHIITSRHLGPLLLGEHEALLVEITDGESDYYRGTLFYDMVKMSVSRLAFACAHDLRGTNATAVAITPGFLRSEAMLDYFGVTVDNWRDGAKKDMHFLESESPFYVGRAVAAIAADRHADRWAGRTVSSGNLAGHYGFTDVDGRQPNFGAYLVDQLATGLATAHAASGQDLHAAFVAQLEQCQLEIMVDMVEPGLIERTQEMDTPAELDRYRDLVRQFFRLG